MKHSRRPKGPGPGKHGRRVNSGDVAEAFGDSGGSPGDCIALVRGSSHERGDIARDLPRHPADHAADHTSHNQTDNAQDDAAGHNASRHSADDTRGRSSPCANAPHPG